MDKESIGVRLRKAREAKKISLDQAYAKTKIHASILQALEEDRFQEFSAVYIKGFLKIYAQFLGLDVAEITKELQETYFPKGQASRPMRDDVSRKRLSINFNLPKIDFEVVKKGLIVVVAIVLFLSLINLVKTIKAKISSAAKQKQVQEEPVVVTPIKEEKKAKFARLAIRAKENSWVRVRLDGKTIFDGTFKKNMANSWQAKEKIELSIGNAGAIEAEINGQVVSPLGRKGQTLKDIVITKDGFSIGK